MHLCDLILYNYNTLLYINLFDRYKYALGMYNYTASMNVINYHYLSNYQSSIKINTHTLIKSSNNCINGFTLDEIYQLIDIIATDLNRLSMDIVHGYTPIFFS